MAPKNEKYFRQIAETIETQEYFDDAKEWYQAKYLYPVIERSFFLFLTIISVICSIIAFAVLSSFLPLTTHIPIAVSNNDPVNQYTTISKMTDRSGYSDADSVVQRYLLKRYVESFETYNYDNNFEQLASNAAFIRGFSIEEMSQYYDFYISLRNTDSMRLKFREHTRRDVALHVDDFQIHRKSSKTVQHTDEDGNVTEYPQHRMYATVNFTSITSNQNGQEKTQWKARIDFAYSTITYIRSKKEFLPLYFKVEDYQSVEIK